MLVLTLGCGGCGPARTDAGSEGYLELLQLASHTHQRRGGEPGCWRFYALRDRLVAEGRLVSDELALGPIDERSCRRHLASCLWLFDTVELGRLCLELEPAGAGWRVRYWIRAEREGALRERLRALQTTAPPLLSRTPSAGSR